MKSPSRPILCLFALLSASAFGDLLPVFKNLDKNRNGYITAEESNKTLDKYFSKLDTDNDEAIDEDEFLSLKGLIDEARKKEKAAKKKKKGKKGRKKRR